MDLISIGIGDTKSRKNERLLRDINSNNTISIKLSQHLNVVNEFTRRFLTQETPQLVSAYNGAVEDRTLTQIQSAFQEIYSVYEVDRTNLKRMPQPSLAKLQSIRDKLNDETSNDEEVRLKDTLATSLSGFVDYYTLIGLNQEVSTTLIYRTIVSINQLSYWQDLADNAAWYAKLVYGLQTLPLVARDLLWRTWGDAQRKLDVKTAAHGTAHGSFTEEDNWVFARWSYVKRVSQLMLEAATTVVNESLAYSNPLTLLKHDAAELKISGKSDKQTWYSTLTTQLVHYWKSPLVLIDRGINAKLQVIHQQLHANYQHIGTLIQNLPLDESLLVSQKFTTGEFQHQLGPNIAVLESIVGGERLSASTTSGKISQLTGRISHMSQHHGELGDTQPPSLLVRWWPILLLLVKYGPGKSVEVYQQREVILDWLKHNFVDTVVGFWNNWVIGPINNMLGVLRNDEINELSITSKESLQSDLDSLERMVIDYAMDNNQSAVDEHQIHDAVARGDLTVLMSSYEKDLKSPVKSLVKGSLLRALLIQIQKTKVDGGVAISGIDKLLKSQQLVFAVVSISPSIVILYQIYQRLIKSSGERGLMINGKNVKIMCLKSLNNIERILISGVDEVGRGMIFVEIINLIIQSKRVIPKQLRGEWIGDLNALNDLNEVRSVDDKLNNIGRIWNMYGPYFR